MFRVNLIADIEASSAANAQARLDAFREATQPSQEYGITLYQPEPLRVERECPGCVAAHSGSAINNDLHDAQCKAEHMHDPWQDDPEYPAHEWRLEVANDDTRLGYLEWLQHKRESDGKLKRSLRGIASALIVAAMLCFLPTLSRAQTFPRWPTNTAIKVYVLRESFSASERIRIEEAVKSWAPFLPDGITILLKGETQVIEQCQGCVTVRREPTPPNEWGECRSVYRKTGFYGITIYALVRIDPRAGSGDDFQRIVEHELGHSLGLSHRPKSVMSARVHGSPSKDDAAILKTLYAQPTLITTLAVTASTPTLIEPAIDVSLIQQSEAAMLAARQRYSARRDVVIQTLGDQGEVTGEYTRVSRIVLADNGEPIEKVISRRSTLKTLKITHQDETDFSGAQMGTIGDFALYRFSRGPAGISVSPVTTDKGRVFKGAMQIDNQGRIARLEGTTLPEKEERFPIFVSTRKEVDGYLFPSETFAEGVLQFPKVAVRVRWRVTVSEYKRFGSTVNVTEVGEQ